MAAPMVPYSYRSPLRWPDGWNRSPRQERSQFRVEARTALKEMLQELARLGARNVEIFTNQKANKDGSLSLARQQIYDRGVAIYFERNRKPIVLACDQYDEIHDNIRAIGKTIEAMRAIERYGASDMMERALTAFEALPAPEQWWQVLEVPQTAGERTITLSFREKMQELTARGGETWEHERLRSAWESGKAAANGR